MKKFDLNEAKNGKPVRTRGGDPVRIICWDSKVEGGNYPIVALVKFANNEECVKTYSVNGVYRLGENCEWDLMMVGEKKEGWINLYKNPGNEVYLGSIYDSENEAISNVDITLNNYVDTVKIEWRE